MEALGLLQVTFSTAGIETYLFVPPVVAFLISFFTSMAGISGAFLLLPFQVSVLGFTSPSVSSTNFLYNVVGTPGGVLRYFREKRLVWPLAVSIIAGTLPGVLIGYYVRIKWLPDPRTFKFFVGIVLIFVGCRLVKDLFYVRPSPKSTADRSFQTCNTAFSVKEIRFDFQGHCIRFSVPVVFFAGFLRGNRRRRIRDRRWCDHRTVSGHHPPHTGVCRSRCGAAGKLYNICCRGGVLQFDPATPGYHGATGLAPRDSFRRRRTAGHVPRRQVSAQYAGEGDQIDPGTCRLHSSNKIHPALF